MKWINKNNELPKLNKEVLLWAFVGHAYRYEIGFLSDSNGKDGYIEVVGCCGHYGRIPNKEYPNNLEWNISGHWYSFDKITHWATLLNKPNLKKTNYK